jgi:hypothetical protein
MAVPPVMAMLTPRRKSLPFALDGGSNGSPSACAVIHVWPNTMKNDKEIVVMIVKKLKENISV